MALGDSANVSAGTSVIAIGNALGQYQNTVDQGIISGLNRSVEAGDDSSFESSESLSGMLQTDALINPGDSGGPLVNATNGTVIGMDTAWLAIVKASALLSRSTEPRLLFRNIFLK